MFIWLQLGHRQYRQAVVFTPPLIIQYHEILIVSLRLFLLYVIARQRVLSFTLVQRSSVKMPSMMIMMTMMMMVMVMVMMMTMVSFK